MSETSDDTPAGHPLVAFTAALEGLLDGVGSAAVWSLTPGEVAELLPRLTAARSRLAGVELAAAAQAKRSAVGQERGATSAAVWWAQQTRQTRPASARLLRLAEALDAPDHAATAQALATGAVLVEQAQVIVDAVEALPVDLVCASVRAEAEEHLVELASRHDARELKRLGDRILEVVAPQAAEEHERRVLEAQEREAWQTARFTLSEDGHGRCHGRFTLPKLQGQMLLKHLYALAAPRHRAATRDDGEDDPGSRAEDGARAGRVRMPLRLGQAFCEYVETHAAVPKAGGISARVVVTMTVEQLLGAETATTLDSGDRISAAQARRIACSAGLIPAVLGGRSQVLDLGRTRRFHTEPQRIAIGLRDRGCTAEGCDWPPSMCHVHHPLPWARGGGTSVTNGRLLCPRHHTLAHDPAYRTNISGQGKLSFHRRT